MFTEARRTLSNIGWSECMTRRPSIDPSLPASFLLLSFGPTRGSAEPHRHPTTHRRSPPGSFYTRSHQRSSSLHPPPNPNSIMGAAATAGTNPPPDTTAAPPPAQPRLRHRRLPPPSDSLPPRPPWTQTRSNCSMTGHPVDLSLHILSLLYEYLSRGSNAWFFHLSHIFYFMKVSPRIKINILTLLMA
jgi:hypothetical protein